MLRADVNDLVNTGLTQTIGQYNDSEHGGVTKAWDNLQMKVSWLCQINFSLHHQLLEKQNLCFDS